MNDQQLEALLLGARIGKPGVYTPLTRSTMAAIRKKELFARHVAYGHHPRFLAAIFRLSPLRKASMLVAGAMAVSCIGLASYAHAQGTDPFTIIKRWVVGEEVQVDYEGQTFKYGKALTYSDAAISAFAEITLVDKLAWEAGNAFMVPKDGIEHVSNPLDTTYVYPWVGTISSVGEGMATVERQFFIGDKVAPSAPASGSVQVPLSDLTFYAKGKSQTADKAVGRLVIVHERSYMRYRTHSKQPPQPTRHYFMFGAEHSIDAIKEAEQPHRHKDGKYHTRNHRIFETDWGDVSTLCSNNGADQCTWHKLPETSAQGLYACAHHPADAPKQKDGCLMNPNAKLYGEGLSGAIEPDGSILRAIEGKITSISTTHLRIRTHSNQVWELAYDEAQRTAYAQRTGSTLKRGDTIGGMIIGSIYDLDNRTIDDAHIYHLAKYKK